MAENICQDNVNPLYNNYFQFVINRGTRRLEFMVQKVNLPGITVPDQRQPTIFGTTVPVPTLVADFDPLNIEFMVDADMVNWLSLYSWIKNITNIQDATTDNLNEYQKWHWTASLIIPSPIVNSSTNDRAITKTNPLVVNFTNIIPIKLSGLIFRSDAQDAQQLQSSCTFKYSYYTIDNKHNPPSNLTNTTRTQPYI